MNDQPTTEELEDVEAHGLKEIAAGIAAAGAVSTGVVAMNMGTSIPPQPIIEQARDDVAATAAHGQDAANTLGGDVTRTGGNLASAARGVADTTLGQAQTLVGGTLRSVDGLKEAAIGSIDRAVDSTTAYAVSAANSTLGTATTAVRNTEDTAVTAANNTLTTANTVVRNTQRTADGAILSTMTTAMSVVRTVQDLANHFSVDVAVLGAAASADGSLTNPGGTVTLTDGTGGVLATADIHDGKATLKFTTPVGGGSLTLFYPGDDVFAPTQLPLHLPAVAM